jgi:hypothetical protein
MGNAEAGTAGSSVRGSINAIQVPMVPQMGKCMQNLGDHNVCIHSPALLLGKRNRRAAIGTRIPRKILFAIGVQTGRALAELGFNIGENERFPASITGSARMRPRLQNRAARSIDARVMRSGIATCSRYHRSGVPLRQSRTNPFSPAIRTRTIVARTDSEINASSCRHLSTLSPAL